MKDMTRIVGLANMLNESFPASSDAGKKAAEFLDSFAAANGFKFKAGNFVDGSDKEFSTFAEAEAELYSFEPVIRRSWDDSISEDPEHYGITYHDDSDMDPEYGYGPYGWYDEDEIAEMAGEKAEDTLAEITGGAIELASGFLNQTAEKDFLKYATDGRGLGDDGCLVLGETDDTDFAIWLER